MAFGFGSGEAARFGRLPNGYLPYIASAREEAGFGGGLFGAVVIFIIAKMLGD